MSPREAINRCLSELVYILCDVAFSNTECSLCDIACPCNVSDVSDNVIACAYVMPWMGQDRQVQIALMRAEWRACGRAPTKDWTRLFATYDQFAINHVAKVILDGLDDKQILLRYGTGYDVDDAARIELVFELSLLSPTHGEALLAHVERALDEWDAEDLNTAAWGELAP